jgi:hypothetical protein
MAANERIGCCLDVFGRLEAVAPHVQVGHEAYEFIADKT